MSERIVFENTDLRKLILKHLVYDKYKKELYSKMQYFITNLIKLNWYKYCSCESCKAYRIYTLANYGEYI